MALHEFCCVHAEVFSRFIDEIKPSTSTLVHSVYYIMNSIFLHKQNHPDDPVNNEHFCRLMINSLLDDGRFARMFIKDQVMPWMDLWAASAKSAEAAGDMNPGIAIENRLWFTHHLAVMLAVNHLPETCVIPYACNAQNLCDEAVLFSLRGMGLTESAIATHYNPSAIQLFTKKIFEALNP